jgi:beta-lactamase superfamily II metal-dependent hydrolase
MEVYFLDVGQGTSNVILLGEMQAVVIDGGQCADATLDLLMGFGVKRIRQLIVSHNHADHARGAKAILVAYRGRVDEVFFLKDSKLFNSPFWEEISVQKRQGHLSEKQIRPMVIDPKPRALLRVPHLFLELRLYSPSYWENLTSEEKHTPNATSAVVILHVGEHEIVFPGDSVVEQWRRIRERRGGPTRCAILVVPHHGGITWKNEQELVWFYSEAIRPEHAVISVATANSSGHPRPEVIKTLMSTGVRVLCTQITSQCSTHLENLRPGVLSPHLPGMSRRELPVVGGGDIRHVGCAGTVLAEVSPNRLEIMRMKDHQLGVDKLRQSRDGHPLCRSHLNT